MDNFSDIKRLFDDLMDKSDLKMCSIYNEKTVVQAACHLSVTLFSRDLKIDMMIPYGITHIFDRQLLYVYVRHLGFFRPSLIFEPGKNGFYKNQCHFVLGVDRIVKFSQSIP